VGDVQKLSRLSGSRVYKFNQADQHRFGKIEVFRRVGSASIDLQPAVSDLREVQINCSDLGPIGLKIGVDSKNGGLDPKQLEQEAKEHEKKNDGKVKAAKEYLHTHSLEVLLSEAMQAVLRERPDNPAEVLAEKIKAAAQARPVKPKAAPAPAAAALAEPSLARSALQTKPFAPYFEAHFKAGSMNGVFKLFPGALKTGPPAPLASKPVQVPILPFRPFYEAHFPCVPQAGMTAIHMRFAAFSGACAKAKPASAAAVPAAHFSIRPSVGTWLMPCPKSAKSAGSSPAKQVAAVPAAPRPALTTTPFTPYFQTHFKCASLETAWNRFPGASKAGPALPKASKPAPVVSVVPFGPFYEAHFPCVPPAGFMAVHKRFAAYNDSMAKAKPASATTNKPAASSASAPPTFALRPSVGTWLLPKPKKTTTPTAAPKAAVTTPAAKPLANFGQMASVGTWLVPRFVKAAEPTVPQVSAKRSLKGLGTNRDELVEVERVLTKALMEITDELAGDYLPLKGSDSYPLRLGGMGLVEESQLRSKGLLFQKTDPSGCGIFLSESEKVAAKINDDGHLRFIAFGNGPEAVRNLKYFEAAVSAALKQDGYELC